MFLATSLQPQKCGRWQRLRELGLSSLSQSQKEIGGWEDIGEQSVNEKARKMREVKVGKRHKSFHEGEMRNLCFEIMSPLKDVI